MLISYPMPSHVRLEPEEIVAQTVCEEDTNELDRLLVAGAVVVREGNHYRIEAGAESWEELEALAARSGRR